jgi:O-antigen/teichoic acid export membrane protein
VRTGGATAGVLEHAGGDVESGAPAEMPPSLAPTTLARSISWLSFGQIVTWAASLAWTFVVPRWIGSSEIGVMTLAAATTGLLGVVIGLGMQPLLVREIASNRDRAGRLVGTAVSLQAILTVPMLATVLVILKLGPFHGEEAVAVLLGWGACLPGVILGPIGAGFQAIQKMRYLALAEIVTNAGGSLLAIVLVVLGARAIALLVVGVVIGVGQCGLYLIWARPMVAIRWVTTWRDIWQLFLASLPFWSLSAFYIIYVWLDSFLLGIMTSTTILGWYGLATRLFSGTLLVFPTILSTAWLPQLVGASQQGRDALQRSGRAAMEVVLILSMPVCLGSILVAGPLVHVLYGPSFAGAVPVFVLLGLCVPLTYFNIMAYQVMVAQRRQMVWLKVMAMATAINLVLNLVLIRYFQERLADGAIGSCLALVGTELAQVAVAVWLVRDVFSKASVWRLVKGGVATVAMGGVVTVALRGGLVLGVGAGLVSFPAFAAGLRVLSREERGQVGALARGIRRRLSRA